MPDIRELFSTGSTIASKVQQIAASKLETANIPGLSKALSDAQNGVLTVTSRFRKQDLVSSNSPRQDGRTPESARDEIISHKSTLYYPAEMKYFTKFSFKKYSRANVAIDHHDLPDITIVLPYPANMQENFEMGYDSPAMGPLYGMAMESFRQMQGAESIGAGVKKFFADTNMDSLRSALGQAGYLGLRGAITGITESFDKGKTAQATDIVTGMVPNPHLTLIFSNVALRQHQFRYLFAPNSEKELQTLKEIIRTLKKRMLPTLAGTSGMLLTFPDTVDIEFGPDKNVPYTIKRCVLASLNINYAPMNSPAMFKTGDPVAVSIDMSFKEIEQYTRKDVPGTDPLDVTTNFDAASGTQ